ncbi:MAG TPA: PTS sugar transporter subunit IIA [bacterium]|nr:PTS sugar transporter subunit IIA [bacterium]
MRLTISDIADMFDVSEGTVSRWVKSDGLPCYSVKGQNRFIKSEVLDWASVKGLRLSRAALRSSDDIGFDFSSFSKALRLGGIHYGLKGTDRESALRSIVSSLRIPNDVDEEFLYQLLLSREGLGSTGVGYGIAIPHPRKPIVLGRSDSSVSLCFMEHPIDFGAADKKPVDIFFLIISNTIREHLHLLSMISLAIHDDSFRKLLIDRASPELLFGDLERIESFPCKIKKDEVAL